MIFDRVLSPEESALVLPELQALQCNSPFHARVIVQSTSGIEQSHVEVDRANGEWFAIDESGYVDEFRDATTFHGGDPAMRGTMVFDYELGLFTRVLHPFSPQILVLDIEVGKKLERFVPDSFPELEVVYPSY